MEKQINEVQSYFKNKILNGDFEVVKFSNYTTDILIDGKFKFCIWVSPLPENTTTFNMNNFMELQIKGEESIKIHSILTLITAKDRLAEKRAELEKLQQELMEGA